MTDRVLLERIAARLENIERHLATIVERMPTWQQLTPPPENPPKRVTLAPFCNGNGR